MNRASDRVTLRQQVRLELPGPLVLPSLLPVLRDVVRADHGAFFFCDAKGNITNLYAERLLPPDVEPPDVHLVIDWSELVERIFLLEEGLDARLIEHVKYMMYQQNPDRLPADRKILRFNAQDSTDEQRCFVVQDAGTRKLEAVLHFARADYEALVNVFDSGEQLALLEEQFPGPYLNGRLRFLQDQAEG